MCRVLEPFARLDSYRDHLTSQVPTFSADPREGKQSCACDLKLPPTKMSDREYISPFFQSGDQPLYPPVIPSHSQFAPAPAAPVQPIPIQRPRSTYNFTQYQNSYPSNAQSLPIHGITPVNGDSNMLGSSWPLSFEASVETIETPESLMSSLNNYFSTPPHHFPRR